MRKTICSGINFFLKPLGLTALERKTFNSLIWEREALIALYEARNQREPKDSEYPAEGIVFSKDRALQLHALLSSYYEKVIPPVPLHILYDTSTPAHQKAYEEVFSLFSGRHIAFAKQNNRDSFSADLINLLTALEADKVFFLVDDLLFIEDVDLWDFAEFNTDRFVPSLRLGLNIDWCYVLQQKQPWPAWVPNPDQRDRGVNKIIAGRKNAEKDFLLTKAATDGDKLYWRWNQGVHEWGYPLSVDGHLFSTGEITAIARWISFQAPNTFEDNLQKFSRLFSSRLGVSYRKSKIVNIPCNKVQEENDNICGTIGPDFLLEQWQKGLQMNYRQLYGVINTSVHQELAFELTPRPSTQNSLNK